MEKFTLKDFIGYNNPCFSCGKRIKLSIVCSKISEDKTNYDAELRPLVSVDGTIVDLQITYNKTLQLYIEHKTNKITISDLKKFQEYIQTHKLHLRTHCDGCQTCVHSFFLDFDLKQHYLKPTGISSEYLYISDQQNSYLIRSKVFDSTTDIKVISNSARTDIINIKTPLLLLGKFKTREKWLHKLKTYLIFS